MSLVFVAALFILNINFYLIKHARNVLNRSKYETQYDVRLEAKDGKVVFNKEKKMSEKKRKYVLI